MVLSINVKRVCMLCKEVKKLMTVPLNYRCDPALIVLLLWHFLNTNIQRKLETEINYRCFVFLMTTY